MNIHEHVAFFSVYMFVLMLASPANSITVLRVLICTVILMLRKPADRLGRVVFANEVSIRGCGGWSLKYY